MAAPARGFCAVGFNRSTRQICRCRAWSEGAMTDWPGANEQRSRGDLMVRRLLVGLVAAGLLLVGAPAFAQPPVTETTVQKNLVETFVDVLPSYTGKFTVWGGFNQNGNTVNGTFTFNVRGSGSDGSTFKNHTTEHFNVRPDGTVNEFFHCH